MSISLPNLTVAAPAKVNLHLKILDRRPDGFHNLESVFLAVNFGDILHFQPVSGEKTAKIDMEWIGQAKAGLQALDNDIPVEKNIIFKALSLFREKTGFNQGLKIRVEKRIPLGGGLGGGSSNAAAALLALNKLAGSPLSRGVLLEMAASLGSDVTFFIYETTAAFVSGRGECIKPVRAPCLFLVLVNPGFPSDTAAAYRLLDEYRNLFPNFITQRREDAKEYERLGKRVTDTPEKWPFLNDFLPVFEEREKSVYNDIISRLLELGADFAGLSGTGSTCFGVFKEETQAERAASALRGLDSACPWNFVELCRSRI